MFVAAAMTCAAEESENVIVVENADAEPTAVVSTTTETNTADIVLNDIDPVVDSRFYVSEDRNVYFIELGNKFIRVRDFKTHKLISTLSIYLHKEAGTWVENADCVMEYEGQYYPAKRILTGKGICYKGAKHRQWVPMNRVRSVEHEYRIWL